MDCNGRARTHAKHTACGGGLCSGHVCVRGGIRTRISLLGEFDPGDRVEREREREREREWERERERERGSGIREREWD